MGVGDWIMATGEVRKLYEINPVPVLILGADNRPQWSEVFDFNHKICRGRTRDRVQVLINGPGVRPYIAGRSDKQWYWKIYGPPRGELMFTKGELDWGKRYGNGVVIVEPNTKAKIGHTNKAWLFLRWQELVNRKRYRFAQCGPIGTKWLENVDRIVTPTFRHVAAILAHSRGLVSGEGGLMHAAAALDKPAVILWSEFIDPTITGYVEHRNIRHANRTCGMRVQCPTCLASMEAISVDEVDENMRSVM